MTQYFVKKVLCLQQKAEKKKLRTPKPKLKQCGDLCDKK